MCCQELFELLEDDDFDVPAGMIKAKNLVVALAAGGLAPENTAYVSTTLCLSITPCMRHTVVL